MNYYNILGVKTTASQDEIKNAYKKLIKKYHPDIYAGDKSFAQKKTAEINVAYDVLSNPQTKREYDESIIPQYNYTPPKYDYNTNYGNNTYNNSGNNKTYSNYNSYKNNRYYSYSNYTGTNDGSEHDYSTYANYEKKYTDYHRSTTPNSNYTDYSKTNDFSSKIEKTFNKLTTKTQIRIGFLVLIIYLLCFASFLFKALDTFKNSSDFISSESTSYSNTYNRTTQNTTVAKNSILNNYFTEEELRSSYQKYIQEITSNSKTASNDDLYLTYEEYIELLEKYMFDVFNSNTNN